MLLMAAWGLFGVGVISVTKGTRCLLTASVGVQSHRGHGFPLVIHPAVWVQKLGLRVAGEMASGLKGQLCEGQMGP